MCKVVAAVLTQNFTIRAEEHCHSLCRALLTAAMERAANRSRGATGSRAQPRAAASRASPRAAESRVSMVRRRGFYFLKLSSGKEVGLWKGIGPICRSSICRSFEEDLSSDEAFQIALYNCNHSSRCDRESPVSSTSAQSPATD